MPIVVNSEYIGKSIEKVNQLSFCTTRYYCCHFDISLFFLFFASIIINSIVRVPLFPKGFMMSLKCSRGRLQWCHGSATLRDADGLGRSWVRSRGLPVHAVNWWAEPGRRSQHEALLGVPLSPSTLMKERNVRNCFRALALYCSGYVLCIES